MKRVFNLKLLFIYYLTISSALVAQSDFKLPSNADPAIADEKFSANNFTAALKDYLFLLKKDPNNLKYSYRVGICYLNTNINKSKAIPYLETESKTEKPDYECWFYLGKVYHFVHRFDEAVEMFTKYKEVAKGNSENKKQVDRYIQYCYNAKELIKFPLNVTFKNLGKNVNSSYSDYQPFVPEDESYIVFSSRRKEGGAILSEDGSITSSVFISKVQNGEFAKARGIGAPLHIAGGDEEVVGLSLSGDIMILVYDNMVSFADLFIAYADQKKNFKKAVLLDKTINSSAQEISASISPDGNTLYFTSTRSGGFGGSDIYVSHKLPNGTWAIAQNLGPEINTDADEDFPNISPDGKLLYFSSTGHTSMGGYDIFTATWSETANEWTNIKNYGYPINTADDDMNLRLSTNGKFGYISALREGGFGDVDIYRVDFNDVEPNYTLVKGLILSADTSRKLDYSKVSIVVTNSVSNVKFGNYVPNPISGKYVMILPPGDYNIQLDLNAFEKYSEKFGVSDKIGVRREIDKNITLLPIGDVQSDEDPKKNSIQLNNKKHK